MMTLSCWIRSVLAGILFLICIPSSRGDELSVRIYKEAKGLYAAERYDEALKRFMDAYVLQPSPRLLQNVAMAHWKQGHVKEAIIFFRRFLKDPSLTTEQRASTERTLSRLQEGEAQQSPNRTEAGFLSNILRRRNERGRWSFLPKERCSTKAKSILRQLSISVTPTSYTQSRKFCKTLRWRTGSKARPPKRWRCSFAIETKPIQSVSSEPRLMP